MSFYFRLAILFASAFVAQMEAIELNALRDPDPTPSTDEKLEIATNEAARQLTKIGVTCPFEDDGKITNTFENVNWVVAFREATGGAVARVLSGKTPDELVNHRVRRAARIATLRAINHLEENENTRSLAKLLQSGVEDYVIKSLNQKPVEKRPAQDLSTQELVRLGIEDAIVITINQLELQNPKD